MQFEKYDVEYYENLLEMYAGSMETISSVRWKMIEPIKAKTILDYGSGNNAFSLFRPDGVTVDSYDIGVISEKAKYPQTGIRHDKYDLICLWDVMEHVDWEKKPDEDMLAAIASAGALAATIPIKKDETVMEEWKHYKPGEHLTYFAVWEVILFANNLGFELLYHGTPECPPRSDIHSFLFRRKL